MVYFKANVFTPNGKLNQCQCVMEHSTLTEGAVAQCMASRCVDSNLFCRDCEDAHGEYWRKKHPEGTKA
jgi:hypothetical protein